MKGHQKQQETESCVTEEEIYAGDTGEFAQPYGNEAAQARLCPEPIDITVVDQRDWVLALTHDLQTPDSQQVDVSEGVAEMVAEVIEKAGDRPIRTLRIEGHGSAGDMMFGESREHVGSLMRDSTMNELSKLAPHFAADGQVIMGGCDFAGGKRGEDALKLLTQLFGVPVSGGTGSQSPFTDRLENGHATASQGEDGEVEFERVEDSEDAMAWKLARGVRESAAWVSELGEGAVEEVEDCAEWWGELGEDALEEIKELLGDSETAEVGELSAWLFGA